MFGHAGGDPRQRLAAGLPAAHASEHIAVWEQHLAEAHPELDARQARMPAHAGFGVVVEPGHLLRWEDRPEHCAEIEALFASAR
ncbi:hypothetical protein [Amycolatopsis rifamycinica]|uniref:Uncharacterized protein n=1 Tax=Amycolatopsis rifamycinica TaxID=287986 RepID=A0A066U2Y5_9PSEU|nr:hypothetical protein DV20_12815 [Amycolatopsis rifamycinica]